MNNRLYYPYAIWHVLVANDKSNQKPQKQMKIYDQSGNCNNNKKITNNNKYKRTRGFVTVLHSFEPCGYYIVMWYFSSLLNYYYSSEQEITSTVSYIRQRENSLSKKSRVALKCASIERNHNLYGNLSSFFVKVSAKVESEVFHTSLWQNARG